MGKVSIADLLARRVELLAELKTVNDAIELLKDSATAIRIRTSRNLRNTYLAEVNVYEDKEMTQLAPISDHEGYICKEDLALLRLEIGNQEGDSWWTG